MEKILLVKKSVPIEDNVGGGTCQVILKIVLGKQTKITENLELTILTLKEKDIETILKNAKRMD